MKECFFYSRYNVNALSKRCDLFEKNIDEIICEKCPFHIDEHNARNIIKRYVFERETAGKHDEKTM